MTQGDHVGPYRVLEPALGSYPVDPALGALWLGRDAEGNLVYLEVRPLAAATHNPRDHRDHRDHRDRAADLRADLDVAQQLRHPNLVRILDAGIDGDREYVATEFVEGLRLPALLEGLREGMERLSPWVVGYIAHRLAQALAYVHGFAGPKGRPLGMLGRPVLPASVNLTRTGGVKLAALLNQHPIDRFDTIANRAPDELSEPVELLETTEAHRSEHDDRSDVFDLGVICWELLSGKPWVHRATGPVMREAVLGAEVPDLPPSVPEPLAIITMRCLSRDADERLRASTVADLLAEAIEDHPEASPEEVRRLVAVASAKLTPIPLKDTAQIMGPSSGEPPPPASGSGQSASRRWPSDEMRPSEVPSVDPFFDAIRDAGGITSPRFEVLGRLGSGGMGDVYRVHDRELDEVVALKMLPHGSPVEPHSLERLRREVRLARNIASDHVCRIFDIVDLGNGARGLTMAVIDGMTLSEMMKAGLQLDYSRFARWGADVAAGLAAAHQLAIVHRDLKPENVMIRNGDDRAIILDFGIALRERARGPRDPRLTQQGIIMGTPMYMSPEQLADHPLDGRSDLYALGLILAELITGEVPRGGKDYPVLLKKRSIDPEPYDILTVDANTPPALAEIVNRLVAPAPDDRPATASLARDALSAAQSGPVRPFERALGPTTDTPAMPMPTRDPSSVAFVLSLLVLAGGVVAVGFWLSLLRDQPAPIPEPPQTPPTLAAPEPPDGKTNLRGPKESADDKRNQRDARPRQVPGKGEDAPRRTPHKLPDPEEM